MQVQHRSLDSEMDLGEEPRRQSQEPCEPTAAPETVSSSSRHFQHRRVSDDIPSSALLLLQGKSKAKVKVDYQKRLHWTSPRPSPLAQTP